MLVGAEEGGRNEDGIGYDILVTKVKKKTEATNINWALYILYQLI